MVVAHLALLFLPILATAQSQVPVLDQVKGWFGKAQSYVQSAVPPVVTSPIDIGASKVAAISVSPITLDNWREVLKPSASAKGTEAEEWMIYVTGANKTCYGLCARADTAWNVRNTHYTRLLSIHDSNMNLLCSNIKLTFSLHRNQPRFLRPLPKHLTLRF